MAIRLKSALRSMLASRFPDQDDMEISPMDVREQLGDHVDSFLAGESVQAGDGIRIDRSTPGTIVISTDGSGGGTPTPPVYPTLRFGTSTNATPTAGELMTVGVNGQGTIDAYTGLRHHLVARVASEGAIRSIIYSDDPSRDNALGAFSLAAQTVDVAGLEWNVWVSNQLLLHPVDTTLTVT